MSTQTLLVLCDANLIRSPLAAAVLRRHLAASDRRDLQVSSAGLQVMPEYVVSEEMTIVSGECGVDLTHHRPTAASAAALDDAALVVTMTETQRTAAERLSRTATPRTFTLRELARLLSGRDASATATWSDLAGAAHSSRPVLPPAAAAEDVPDPVGRDAKYHRMIATDIVDLCGRLSSLVAPRLSLSD